MYIHLHYYFLLHITANLSDNSVVEEQSFLPVQLWVQYHLLLLRLKFEFTNNVHKHEQNKTMASDGLEPEYKT